MAATVNTERPYGFVARVRRRVPGTGNFLGLSTTQTVTIRRKGSERVVRRAARLVGGFIEVESVEAYRRDEWLRCFGEGRS